MTLPEISIVVPLYNEEENVRPLCNAVREALKEWPRTWELLLVDDGSRDHTVDAAAEEAAADPRLRLLGLKRNQGQTMAMATGFAKARGRIIVSMDGDLQNDPCDIPMMVSRIDDGFDLVCGWRKQRKDLFLSRRLPSLAANALIAWITGVHIHDNGCSLKAYRAAVIQTVRLYSEMHRFLPALVSMTGARITEVVVRHHPRIHGQSAYGLSRVFRVLGDMIIIKMLTQFSNRPGQWFGLLALPFLVLALVLAGVWAGGIWFSSKPVSIIYPSLSVLSMYMFGSLMTSSILSEMLLAKADKNYLRDLTSVLAVVKELGPHQARNGKL
ncbi:MAG: glycosyltransferase family 2 protein [Candidatus Eisenbacteria bacterium]|uniref:Glycosyltransferase family 2 protein n=1 Tax=Eiseniibacteriota bacterium TaxID=2212470 RepID=A0A948RSY5_UNCEI|nr:glycosyltransferase family 2 protein [Candidatus Eisenbacteria bacterium]